jgi:hypothetical protein
MLLASNKSAVFMVLPCIALYCRQGAAVSVLLLVRFCWCAANVGVLLLVRFCWCASVGALLLLVRC